MNGNTLEFPPRRMAAPSTHTGERVRQMPRHLTIVLVLLASRTDNHEISLNHALSWMFRGGKTLKLSFFRALSLQIPDANGLAQQVLLGLTAVTD